MGRLILFLTLMFPSSFLYTQNHPVISVDFPGGNILVDGSQHMSTLYYDVLTDTIHLRPDLRDTKGKWFYWYFRVTGAEGKRFHFQFPFNAMTSFGPAISTDEGNTWKWLYEETRSIYDSFSYSFGPSDSSVLFCLGIPYLEKDFKKFANHYATHPLVSLHTLTKSEKGRDIEEMRIRSKEVTPEYKMVITARHHACEMMASYVLEGFLESVLDGENQEMKWLRNHVEFVVIPFVDKDGVEDGDQGKYRIPRDHNRDYSGDIIYNSTRAIQNKVKSWGGKSKLIGMDLHCPTLSGMWNEHAYFVGTSENAHQQKRFVNTLVKHHRGILDLDTTNLLLEYGQRWNTASNYTQGTGFISWMTTLAETSLGILLEFPYANNMGQQISPHNARIFGRDMAEALAIYLEGNP